MEDRQQIRKKTKERMERKERNKEKKRDVLALSFLG